MTTAKTWDLPTRLFHWTLAIGVGAAWWTADNGHLESHEKIGLGLISLLIFRILWGVVGSPTARFAHFVRGPGAALRHLGALWSMRQEISVGHNAAGGWMVLVLLAVVGAQAAMGLFATDGLIFWGPLSGLVSGAWQDRLTAWHTSWFNVILAMVALHVTAVLFYVFLGDEDLIRAMITGYKPGAPPPPRTGAYILASPKAVAIRAGLCAAAALALGWGGIGAIEALAT